jgi:HEAT repeat protein
MDSRDTPVSIPPQEDLTEVRKPTSLLVAQFFLFPLIIIAFGVGIFVLFGSVAFEQKTPEAYLAEIRAGGGYVFDSRRWQAAYELANLISAQKAELRESRFADELLSTYVASRPEDEATATEADWQLRQYLAFGLGELGSHRFVPALIDGLSDGATQTQIYTIFSLGKIGDPSAAPEIAGQLANPDSGVRMAAAYVLGALGNSSILYDLRVALNDSAAGVRWNAAMALARMDDRSGADVLLELTDRSYLAEFTEISDQEKSDIIVNAVRCLGLLRLERARDHIVLLSENDPSVAVRSAALEVLQTF